MRRYSPDTLYVVSGGGADAEIHGVLRQLQQYGLEFADTEWVKNDAGLASLPVEPPRDFGINGDEAIDDVVNSHGQSRRLTISRPEAASRFNGGQVRFLVSTEAAGEGIDLQRNCHTLVHVDLPWNPMRMHQRVGRLNRYGQDQVVEVISVRNPDTVESRIWDKLITKLANITSAIGQVMAEPEDLQQLVLGMTSPLLLRDLFTEAVTVPPESLDQWFDRKTATFWADGHCVGTSRHHDRRISSAAPDYYRQPSCFSMTRAASGTYRSVARKAVGSR